MARPFTALADRFWPKVQKGENTDDCWLWMASLNTGGYGQIGAGGDGGRPLPAHRVVYELLVGPIPEGLTIDHLCRNRPCVNPWYLEPVTNRENILRGVSPMANQARQTHCIHGHPFDAENTFVKRNGKRECRSCYKPRMRARYRKLKDAGLWRW